MDILIRDYSINGNHMRIFKTPAGVKKCNITLGSSVLILGLSEEEKDKIVSELETEDFSTCSK